MRYCRFLEPNGIHYGFVETKAGHETVFPFGYGPPEEHWALSLTEPRSLQELRLLPPVRPSKIVCVGRNYREHAKELGNPVPEELLTFLKPPSTVIGPGERIVRPSMSQRVDHEGELAIVIGKTCRNLRRDDDVRPYIRGFTCANDVTARDIQKKDTQWTRGKGFDTFCPVGPIVTDEIDPWAGVQVQTRVNDQLRQDANTRQFIFSIEEILRYITRVMTLFPGDLIPTGTPAGVGQLQAGDTVEVRVEGIGSLANPVVDEKLDV
ncbi:MAG: fumarylacetoacetate hydrolase family protein [Acidobacteriia bacterium]|nr:fumarylacetoacetate hydrolase family protein [Terriglobia bacterium]